ncbi:MULTISPECIES: thioredoxin domain-containing protein [Muribaculum]|uniref:thioredoxin family protein n=1 Tax=Muribaculum TaxID=1918540 RepID=UPI000F48E0D2|nr:MULTISPECIES: thioredoxin domain-containing protein [Muribaculum]MCX4277513.1 thioredoxin domain-containing protein [Muribaculum sp.]ROT14289.1 thiol reductase thioredoxin [Muribaculaceae bacterium Isolate-102 (HZI)]
MIRELISATMLALSVITVSADNDGKVESINQAEFSEKIFDYSTREKPVIKSERPAVIDFWAPWCGTCRRLAPVMDSLAVRYKGKVDFYKINIDNNEAIARQLRVSSIPLVLFVPVDGNDVQGMMGVYPTDAYVDVVDEYLLGMPSKSR